MCNDYDSVCDVFEIYDNDISFMLIMILTNIIILYFKHMDTLMIFHSTDTRLVVKKTLTHYVLGRMSGLILNVLYNSSPKWAEMALGNSYVISVVTHENANRMH